MKVARPQARGAECAPSYLIHRSAHAYVGAFLKRPTPAAAAGTNGRTELGTLTAAPASEDAASHLYDIGTFAQV